MRGRAEVARRAHNPEVSGSNPLPATNHTRDTLTGVFYVHEWFEPAIRGQCPLRVNNQNRISLGLCFFDYQKALLKQQTSEGYFGKPNACSVQSSNKIKNNTEPTNNPRIGKRIHIIIYKSNQFFLNWL